MRPIALAVAALLIGVAASAAHADTFSAFRVAINFEHGVSFYGQVLLDPATNTFTDLGGLFSGLPTGNGIVLQTNQGVRNGNYFLDAMSSGPYTLDIVLPVSSLAGYTGGPVCTETLAPGCSSSSSLDFQATGGSITPTSLSPIPEPSTVTLFGTGLLGLAGVIRKRLASDV